MKLNNYEVRMNSETFEPELGLSISIPLALIDNLEQKSEQEGFEFYGKELSKIFKQIVDKESKQ